MSVEDVDELSVGFTFDFNFLGDYLWKMERALDALRERELRVLEELSGRDREMREAWERPKIEWLFPSSLRYSYLTLLFTHVEWNLREACDLLHRKSDLPIRERELKGGALDRAKTYLDRFTDVGAGASLWRPLNDLSMIRNCVAHAGGRIARSRRQRRLEDLVRQEEHLRIGIQRGTQEKFLVIEEPYAQLLTKEVAESFASIAFGLLNPEELEEWEQ